VLSEANSHARLSDSERLLKILASFCWQKHIYCDYTEKHTVWSTVRISVTQKERCHDKIAA